MEDLRINEYMEVSKMSALVQAKVVDPHDEKAKYELLKHSQNAQKKERSEKTEEMPIEKLVEMANHYVDRFTTKISFVYDPSSKTPKILVREKDTGRVIRQIPPVQMMKLMKKMDEIAGIIYNGRA